jgi:AsmA family
MRYAGQVSTRLIATPLRYLLTVLAILVIIVFSAALAVPYFVNWNDQRAIVAARLSELVGAEVKINGSIDLKLLPTPYLLLGDLRVVDPKGKSTAEVAEMRLEIALAPLLRGDVDFVEARLVRPRFHLQIEDGVIRLPQPVAVKGTLHFERISIEDGDIVIADPAAGRNYALAGLDLEAQAPSLEGPFKGEGRIGSGAKKTALRFSTATLENDRLRFKFILDEAASHPRTELDGSLVFDPSGHALPALDAQLTVSGHVIDAPTMPWRLGGNLHAELRAAKIADLDLRLGDDDHSVSVAGNADFDLGATTHAHFALSAKQVNLDRLLTENAVPPPPQRLEDAARKWMAAPPALPMPVTVQWAFDSILLGSEAFNDVSGTVSLSKPESTALRFSLEGPGQSRLMLDGKLESGSTPAFDGRVEAAAGDLTRLKDWITTNLPDTAAAKGALPVRSCDVAGKVNVSPVGFFGSDLRLRLDRTTLAGSLAYTRAVGGDPPRLYADLSADAVEIDHLPDMRAVFDSAKPMDLSLRLDSRAIKVADVGQGPIDAGRIVLKLTKAGAQLKLEKLDIAGLGGINLRATGSLDDKIGQIETKLDAENLADAASLLHRLVPGPGADLLSARASLLSPAHLTMAAEVRRGEADSLALTSFSLNGATAQTNVKAKLAPDPRDASHVTFTGHLDAPETGALFRQLGLSTLPLKSLGGGQVDLSAQGELAKPLDTQISATLAGTKLDFRGTLKPDLAAPSAKGAIKIASRDLSGLMEMTALAFPDLTGRMPADVGAELEFQANKLGLHKLEGSLAGVPVKADLTYATAPRRHLSGSLELATISLADFIGLVLGPAQPVKAGQVWSDGAFAGGLINPPTTSLAINAKSFTLWPGIVGANAKMDLDIASDEAGPKLALRLFYTKLGAGGAEAYLAMRRDADSASAAGHITLEDYPLDLPSAAGNVNANVDFASTGQNAAALITGLAGSGAVTTANLSLPRSDPRALARVFKAVEADQIGIDEGEIARVLTREFDKKPLTLRSAEFDAALAAGVLRLTPKAGAQLEGPAPDQKITCSLQATIDWHNLTFDRRALLSLGNLPKNWKGPPPQVSLISQGPIARPERTLDAATFTNMLAARAIARESARIELQEFDFHERTVAIQRLKSERRREQERIKAEQERLRAELERRRAEEEVRRAIEEAKRAAEEVKRAADPADGVIDSTSGERRPEQPLELHRSPVPPMRPQSLRPPTQ